LQCHTELFDKHCGDHRISRQLSIHLLYHGKVNHVWQQSFLFCNVMAVSVLLNVIEPWCLSVVTGFTFNNGLLQIREGLLCVCMVFSCVCSFIINTYMRLVMCSNTIQSCGHWIAHVGRKCCNILIQRQPISLC